MAKRTKKEDKYSGPYYSFSLPMTPVGEISQEWYGLDPEGEWVRREDYEKLEERVRGLEKELKATEWNNEMTNLRIEELERQMP